MEEMQYDKVPAVFIQHHLPSFWAKLPTPNLWFKHLKNVTPLELENELKYHLMISMSDRTDLLAIFKDVIFKPLDKHSAFKRHLLFIYRVSTPLSNLTFEDDMRPTQILMKLRDHVGGNMVTDEFHQKLTWISHLPSHLRVVLCAPCCSEMSLDNLALVADLLVEQKNINC